MATLADPQDTIDPDQNENPDMPQQPVESPKTLTLEDNRPQEKSDDPENPIEEEADLEDPDFTVPSSPPNTDLPVTTSATVGSRRGGGPKRKKLAAKRRFQEKKYQKKLEILTETLKPIPFLPNKTLDFASHEKLLKRLGLWDFAHLEFDGSIRTDLIAQLISTYSQQSRCSYVNGFRIRVNRADLGRALKLSVRKDKDSFVEVEESKESVSFIEEFVSNWVLLHEDTWMMASEVLNWTKMIRGGHFEKVDWAGLIWFMVEKELMAAPKLENCYYASHMQCLIKSQKEDLLQDEPKMNVEEANEEDEEHNIDEDVKMVADGVDEFHGRLQLEEHNIDEDVKMVAEGVDEFHGRLQLEEHNIELSLGGQDNMEKEDISEKEAVGGQDDFVDNDGVEKEAVGGQDNLVDKDGVEKEAVADEDDMDCEESKGDENQHVQWHLDGDNYMGVGGDHILRRCNIGTAGFEGERKQDRGEDGAREDGEEMGEGEEVGDEEGDEMGEGGDEEDQEEEDQDPPHEEGFPFSPKADALGGVNSTNLLEAMEAEDLPFTAGLHIRNNSSGEFLVPRGDNQTIPGVSSFLSSGNKRVIGDDNDFSHHSLNGSNKRFRSDVQWVDKSSDFDMCMDQMQHWIGKARMLYAAKEQEYGDSSMHQQMLLEEVHQRDRAIEHLQKAKQEEQHKRQMEVYKLERELYMMGNLLDGYKMALKETTRAFAEYRARCPLPDEPLYKDVTGSGGLVLSTTELEKLRLKQEEEERLNKLLIEKKIKDFEAGWIGKFDVHGNAVSLLSKRLINAEKDVEHLKELLATRKVPYAPECGGNE